MNKKSYDYFVWIVVGVMMGYMIPAVFSGILHLSRNIYLIPYVILTGIFLTAFARWSEIDFGELFRRNWIWGLVGAVLVGIFVVRNIMSQPASEPAVGLELVFEILWAGVVYGLMDALLLSVFPIVAVSQAFKLTGMKSSWKKTLLVGGVSLIASLLITVIYHLGYPEFRGVQVSAPAFGNTVMSLGALVTNNPLAAIFSHIAMHVAAVLHGPASVMQLPPHF